MDTTLIAVLGFAGVCMVGNLCGAESPDQKSVVRFGMVADLHYAGVGPYVNRMDVGGTRYFTESKRKLDEAVATFNARKVDFVIELGDIKDNTWGKDGTLKHLREIEKSFAAFDGPRYHVAGNHDFDCLTEKEFYDECPNGGEPWTCGYYAFEKNGIRFLVLDGCYTASMKHYSESNPWDDSNFPPEEMEWIQRELDTAKGPVVVFCHQRLDTECEAKHDVKQAAEVRAMFEKSGKVKSVFMGHQHKGGIIEHNGIVYYSMRAIINDSGEGNNAFAEAFIAADGSCSVYGWRNAASFNMEGEFPSRGGFGAGTEMVPFKADDPALEKAIADLPRQGVFIYISSRSVDEAVNAAELLRKVGRLAQGIVVCANREDLVELRKRCLWARIGVVLGGSPAGNGWNEETSEKEMREAVRAGAEFLVLESGCQFSSKQLRFLHDRAVRTIHPVVGSTEERETLISSGHDFVGKSQVDSTKPVPDETEVLKARRIFDTQIAGLSEIGTLKPRTAKEIKESCVSVGFECLDRELFDPSRCYDHVANAGVKYARCQTGWSRCENTKGVYDFAWLDDVVDNFASRGVEAWFNVTFGNTLYMTNCYTPAAVGNVPLYYGEECQNAWCAYVRALAKHFKGRVKCWEIWNEPNVSAFWVPRKPDPAEYIKLIDLTANEIRKEIPDAKIGACVSSVLEPYTGKFVELGGGKNIDFFCVHPYTTAPEHLMSWDAKMSYVEAIGSIRGGLAKHGAPQVEVWNGESGYNYWYPKKHWLYGNSEEICSAGAPAKWLLRRFLTDRIAGCGRSSFFQTVDMVKPYAKSSSVWKRPPRAGLLDGDDYTPRMSWYALRNYNALFPAAVCDSTVVCRVDLQTTDEVAVPLEAVALRENDKLFYAWWARPDDVRKGYSGSVDGQLVVDAAKCPKEPVIVDLLSGKVYDCTIKPSMSSDGKTAVYSGLPITDWPLVMTERRNVAIVKD